MTADKSAAAGKRIKAIRESRGLTQNDVAEILGVSTAAISQYENGNWSMRLSTLNKLADALRVPVAEILGTDSAEQSEISLAIGQRIKTERKKAGMTQKELAEKAGLAVGTIQQYERGLRRPNYDALNKLKVAFGMPASTIAEWELEYAFAQQHIEVVEPISVCGEAKHILLEQMKLLHEHSEGLAFSACELSDVSRAMVTISEAIIRLEEVTT